MFQDSYNNYKNKTLKGYTLLEIAVAILFFSITVICLSLPLCQSISLSSSEQDMVNANNLARMYLKSIDLKWQFQTDYDQGELPQITSTFTSNDKYNVTTAKQDIAQNSSSIVIVRRVNIEYKDKKNNTLVNLFMDFNRPESTIK